MKTKGNIWMSADKDTKHCLLDTTLELRGIVTIKEMHKDECWDLGISINGDKIIAFDFNDRGGMRAICYIPKKAIVEFLKTEATIEVQ